MRPSHSLKSLFISVTRQKLLGVFFSQPREIFYVRQLVRLVDEEINSVRRELKNLLSGSIITSEVRGNRVYYGANPKSWLFTDLLTLTAKVSNLATDIKSNQPKIGKVEVMVYSFSYLCGESSSNGIDIVIVGEISLKALEVMVKKEETRLGREVDYMVMDRSEFRLRRQKRDPVIVDLFLNSPSIIIGCPSDIY
ncbi:MAG: hypothetical protein WCV93_04195 [Candidatus Shapirobacteria bacterium]|jgi:hypothetical protein